MLVKRIPKLKGTQMKRCVTLVSLTVLLIGGFAQAAVEKGDTEIQAWLKDSQGGEHPAYYVYVNE